jgi:hypothetical protein
VPLLLNVVEIVESVALPLLVKVPWLFTAAVVPLSVPLKLAVAIFKPLLVLWSLNVAPPAIVRIPEPGAMLSFSRIWTNVPLAVLAPPSCSVRPPSSLKLVEVNAAPPCAIVVPDPSSVPPDKLDIPDTVSVPDPLRRPPDWVSAPTLMKLSDVSVPPLMVSNPPMLELAAISIAPPAIVIAVLAPVVSRLIVDMPVLKVTFTAGFIRTSSSTPGRPPVSQFDAVLQLPPILLIH